MNLNNIDINPKLNILFEELDTLASKWVNLEDARSSVNNTVDKFYRYFLNIRTSSQHKDDKFEDSLYLSVENVVMAALHEEIFSLICSVYKEEDEQIFNKCSEMCKAKVTADQLGALEDYSIPLPAAIVELASLDMHLTPVEKLTCLSTAFDLTLAELKGAIVDIIAITADHEIPVLNASDITPILATLIIHTKPIHLISNLFYIEHFKWSKNTNAESECLMAFKTAVDKIKIVTQNLLQPKSQHVYYDMQLEDVMKIVSEIDAKFDRNGERISIPTNPLEKYVEHLTHMISTSTLSAIQM